MKEMTALEAAESLEEMGRIKDMGRPPTDDIERRAAKMIRHMQSRLEELNQKVEGLEKENRYLNDGCAELEALIKSMENDAARLDWLDTQVKRHVVYSGYAWQEAGYESDRGLVCMIQGKRDRMSARQAIDTAIQANSQ